MNLTLVKKVEEVKDKISFFFQPDEDFDYESGQYIYITIPKLNYEDPRGNTRHFTISSSPTEGNMIRITTIIRETSGFKKTLNELPIGEIVEGKGPQGYLKIDDTVDTTKNNIFLAGGIGITPFRSIIKFQTDTNSEVKMHLIYSNSGDDFLFKNEINILQEKNKNLKVTYFNSSNDGHLDDAKLKNLVSDEELKNSTFWIVGPNVFVNAMEEVLEKIGVLNENIKTEKITGY